MLKTYIDIEYHNESKQVQWIISATTSNKTLSIDESKTLIFYKDCPQCNGTVLLESPTDCNSTKSCWCLPTIMLVSSYITLSLLFHFSLPLALRPPTPEKRIVSSPANFGISIANIIVTPFFYNLFVSFWINTRRVLLQKDPILVCHQAQLLPYLHAMLPSSPTQKKKKDTATAVHRKQVRLL